MNAIVSPTPMLTRLMALPPSTLNIVFAIILDRTSKLNEALPKGTLTRFHAKVPSPIDINVYLNRLQVYTPFPRDAVFLTLVYLDRLTRIAAQANHHLQPAILLPDLDLPGPRGTVVARARSSGDGGEPLKHRSGRSPPPILNAFTKHRLLLSVMLVTAKYISDGFIPQARAAKVGGVGLAELVQLEVDALACLSWDLSFSLDELEQVAEICIQVGEQEGKIDKQPAGVEVEPSHTLPTKATLECAHKTAEDDDSSSDPGANTTPQASSTPVTVSPLPSAPPLQPAPLVRTDTSALSSESSSASASPSLLNVDLLSPAPSSPPSSIGYQSEDEQRGDTAEATSSSSLTSRASSDTVRDLALDRLSIATTGSKRWPSSS